MAERWFKDRKDLEEHTSEIEPGDTVKLGDSSVAHTCVKKLDGICYFESEAVLNPETLLLTERTFENKMIFSEVEFRLISEIEKILGGN